MSCLIILIVEITNQADSFGRVETQSTKINNTSDYVIEYNYNSFPYFYDFVLNGLNETSEISNISYSKKTGETNTPILPTLRYEYYTDGNIHKVYENDIEKVRYYYDSFDQLIRENNKYLNNGSGYTITYSYDDGGNMLEKKVYSYTTATNVTNLTPIDTITYFNQSTVRWMDMKSFTATMQTEV